jgi:peptidoglycan hydrolase-like protein with peptidoglycan-binding domain
MRFSEFKLLEEKQKLYAIGDSHAKAIGSRSGWIDLATNGRSALSADNDSAIDKVVNGSLVVLSAGANDMLNPNKATVVGRIENLINKLKQKKCTVYYILFASTDNPKFAKDRNQLRDLVKSAIGTEVAVLDMGKLSVTNGDGIHAPMSWYAQAAQKAASGAKDYAPQTNQGVMQDTTPAGDSAVNVIDVPTSRTGPAVADIQKVLLALGYKLPKHGVDGVRGPETRSAIAKFQTDNGLAIDGDPGPQTVGMLNKLVASKQIKFVKSTQADVKSRPAGANGVEPGSSAVGATPDMDTLAMIKSFEGFAPKAYWDHKQWSIGYGSFAGSNRSKPDVAGPISKERAESMLSDHVQKFSNDVERWNRVGNYKWNEGQKGALISFAYNIGSISQLTDQGKRDNATIAKKMLAYSTASGQVVPGLVNRRRVEQQKFVMNTPELGQKS